MQKIKSSKASGTDKIPDRLLKDSATVVAHYLKIIFNVSLSEGINPERLETIARVSPIYKSGKKDECDNYRPISAFSTISRIFEKLLYEQVNKYILKNYILTSYQSGFRSGHSTYSSLLKTTNTWFVNMDKGHINGVIFLDL